MAARSEALENAFQEATHNIDSMQPKIDHLRDKLVDLDSFMAENLHHTAKVRLAQHFRRSEVPLTNLFPAIC